VGNVGVTGLAASIHTAATATI